MLQSFAELLVPEKLLCIADIGASYLEPPPYDTLIKNKLARIIGFEPNQAECDKLQQIYAPPHQFYPAFVGRGGAATFHETISFHTGSLYRPNPKVGETFTGLMESMQPVAEHQVNTVALDELLGDEVIDYIKIDVQGGELAVFEGAQKILQHVLVVHTEVEFVEMYAGQPLFSDVDQFMRKQGLSLVKFINMRSGPIRPLAFGGNVNNGGSQLLWSDALYMRGIVDLEALSTEQLVSLALICHDVYRLYDLSYHLLREYDRRSNTNLLPRYL